VDRFDWLRKLDVKVVLDGGANQGQWVEYCRQIWPDAKYVCFEPLPECASNIPRDDKVTVVEMALGDRFGKVSFNRSSFNQSSSVLKMGDLHKKLYPFSAGESTCEVEMTTMDEWCEKSGVWPDLVKLDLQGYELQAMIHSPRVMMKAKVVCCETSFLELYDGQPLFGEVHDYMTQIGFRYMGCIQPPMGSPEDGTPLEEDSWWVKVV
jgi:FkbM family methyltransferase